MLGVLLWSAAALLAALLVVLILPVRLEVHAQSEPHWKTEAHISILGGTAPAIRVFDSDQKGSEDKAKAKKKRPKRGKKRKASKRRLDWARAIPRLLNSLWHMLTIERLTIHAVFGCQDPADTGAVFGFLTPWIYSLPHAAKIQLNVQPDFGRACLVATLDIAIKLTPIRLIAILLRFGWDLFVPRGKIHDDHLASARDGRRSEGGRAR